MQEIIHTKNKLEELILYISRKSENDIYFGKTKLNKILFTIDFNFYGMTGKSVSGEVYVHREHGPVPQRMKTILDRMLSEKRIEIQDNLLYSQKQQRVIAKENPDLSKFTEDELRFIDVCIETLKNYTGTQLSEWTHTLRPWLNTLNEEEIPYHAIFGLKKLPVEREGFIWAQKELQRLRAERSYAF